MVLTNLNVSIDLADIETGDMISYLKGRGYFIKRFVSMRDDEYSNLETKFNDRVKSVVKFINDNGENSFLKEVLYEYLGMGHFNDVDTLCEELKKRLS